MTILVNIEEMTSGVASVFLKKKKIIITKGIAETILYRTTTY